jgi:2-hydroxy-3-oxopropionate reductase
MDNPVGFAGLGVMGLPMAVNLAGAGVPVLGWNRSQPARDTATARGVTVVEDLARLGRSASLVFTMLPDLPHVEAILDGLRAPGSALTTLVVMGTVSPAGVARLATDLGPYGIEVIDAPVSGGQPGARAATLSIMVGATVDGYARVRPYLEAMGRTVRHLGPVGAGSLAKACNQIVVAATVAALAEAVLLAERGGLPVEEVLTLLDGGLASSEVLRQKRAYLESGDFTGPGHGSYLVKDLGFGLAAARDEGVTLPVTRAVAALYDEVAAQGLGHLDNSAVLAALRRLAPLPSAGPTEGAGDR